MAARPLFDTARSRYIRAAAASERRATSGDLLREVSVDPLTAALTLANTVAKIILLTIESQSPALRAEVAQRQWDDFKAFRAWIDALMPKS